MAVTDLVLAIWGQWLQGAVVWLPGLAAAVAVGWSSAVIDSLAAVLFSIQSLSRREFQW